MKRYQIYLDPRSVGIFDEASEISDFTRSRLIKEAIDGAASRIGNILAILVPPKKHSYSTLDKMVGSIKIKGKRVVNLSENVDEIYYK